MNLKKIIVNFTLIFLLALFTSSCGFKIASNPGQLPFKILEVTDEGEKRINYNLKNKINFASNNKNDNLVKVHLITKKKKSIKEKNIKNEITKYQLVISTKVKLNLVSLGQVKKYEISKQGDYSVNKQYSTTLSKEKKLIDLLTEKIGDEILEELSKYLNAI